MAKRRLTLTLRDGKVSSLHELFSAQELREHFGQVRIQRASHIEPIAPPGRWLRLLAIFSRPAKEACAWRERHAGSYEILWCGEYRRIYGRRTDRDEQGRPFWSKRQAEALERSWVEEAQRRGLV